MIRRPSLLAVVADGYSSCEGPAFDRSQNLWFVNTFTGSILRRLATGETDLFANTGGLPAGLAFHRDGTLYVADQGEQWHGVLKVTAEGRISPWVTEYEGRPLNGANDLVFDCKGVLYFSDPWGSSLDNPVGGFYRAFPDGRLDRIDGGLAFPNGVAIDAAQSAVYLAETETNRVLRYTLHPDGHVGGREEFARLSGLPGPDGMAFDVEGNLFVAHWDEGRVDVLDPQGRELDHIPTPGRRTTNVAFGGPDRATLIITERETASVYGIQLGTQGQPLFSDLK